MDYCLFIRWLLVKLEIKRKYEDPCFNEVAANKGLCLWGCVGVGWGCGVCGCVCVWGGVGVCLCVFVCNRLSSFSHYLLSCRFLLSDLSLCSAIKELVTNNTDNSLAFHQTVWWFFLANGLTFIIITQK